MQELSPVKVAHLAASSTGSHATSGDRRVACDRRVAADQADSDAPLISAPSDRGRQKVDRAIQVSEGETQFLRRLSEDGLAR